jgi:hypothetical protein
MVGDIGPVAACVHPQRPADGAGDGPQEGQVPPRRRRALGHLRIQRRRARDHRVALDAHFVEAAPEADHHALDPAVPHDQVGPDAHGKDRYTGIERFRKSPRSWASAGWNSQSAGPPTRSQVKPGQIAVRGQTPARLGKIGHAGRISRGLGSRQSIAAPSPRAPPAPRCAAPSGPRAEAASAGWRRPATRQIRPQIGPRLPA